MRANNATVAGASSGCIGNAIGRLPVNTQPGGIAYGKSRTARRVQLNPGCVRERNGMMSGVMFPLVAPDSRCCFSRCAVFSASEMTLTAAAPPSCQPAIRPAEQRQSCPRRPSAACLPPSAHRRHGSPCSLRRNRTPCHCSRSRRYGRLRIHERCLRSPGGWSVGVILSRSSV